MILKLRFLILVLLVNAWGTVQAEESFVVFDKQTQQLKIRIENWSLERTLQTIAVKTGYTFYTVNNMDLSDLVSMDAEGSVHELLPRLARDYSTIISENDEQQTMVWILPVGESQSSYLKDGTAVRAIIAETDSAGNGKRRHRRDMSEEEWHQYRKQRKQERKEALEGTQQ